MGCLFFVTHYIFAKSNCGDKETWHIYGCVVNALLFSCFFEVYQADSAGMELLPEALVGQASFW